MLPHLSLLLFTCTYVPLQVTAGAGLQLKDGDRIVLVGGTLIEREQRYGYWEAALTLMHPNLDLKFRNLGWSGDTVYGDSRAGFGTAADGYKLLKEQIFAAKPTVLLLAYGGNESFEGQTGLLRFREGMLRLLNDLAPLHARTILLAPVDQIRPVGNANRNIQLYRDALRDLAKKRNVAFGEVLSADRVEARLESAHWTDDGIQLNAEGYRHTAPAFCRIFAETAVGVHPAPKLSLDATKTPLRYHLNPGLILPFSATQVAVNRLAPGDYRLSLESSTNDIGKIVLATATASEWAKGNSVRFDVANGSLDMLRKAVVAKNVHYFNRYRPQNETYLFGFRKHEQGQNAVEVPEFDKLVAEAEAHLAKLRTSVRIDLVLDRVER